ncbi:MAG: RNA polymerase factor sigma-54, partial [Xanthomonadales bacterium]|nr:RNA polymerase factor sigma-54 [Gammaproteobacteria bacterium]NNK37830.1 RNA polymerase factor sigma-54 [Xanthomonadales bacterium]
MAEPSLQLRLSQKLALSPQLQQAIRLLQLNRIELREYIQETLDANPILERDEDEAPSESPDFESTEQAAKSETAEDESYDWEAERFEADTWTDGGSYEAYQGESQIPDTSENSLRDHLLWQINLAHFSDVDTAIAQAIVFGLDDEGLLQETLEEIRASLAPELLVEEDEVLAVLHRVQRLEPVGVASRDPAECIRVQLSALPSDTDHRDLALRIARDYLDLVARHEIGELCKRTSVTEEKLLGALELIQSLEPRPGARYDNRRDEYLVPDV